MKIKVLYEDKDILAIDKPSGIAVHPDGKSKAKTISDWVLENYPKLKKVGEPMGDIIRPGIVHRLDKDTSGVLLIAKNQRSYESLKNQFSAPALGLKTKSGLADRENRIKKTYIAIVNGWMKDDRGIIKKEIGRSPTDFRRYLSGRGARGEMREAITQYRVLKRFKASCVQNFSRFTLPRVRGGTYADKNSEHTAPFSYLEIKPKTGRTHQIRVHMKFLNHPIVCDSLYNPKGVCLREIKRMALHALSIEFKNLKGENIKIESKIPEEFKKVLE